MSRNRKLVVPLIFIVAMLSVALIASAGANATTIPGENTVTFTETGLVPGTLWVVTFNGVTYNSTSVSVTITVSANGTYDYRVSSPLGYTPSPSSGTVVVSNYDVAGAGNVTEVVSFTTINPSQYISSVLSLILEIVASAVIVVGVIIGLVRVVPVMLGSPDQKQSALEGMKYWLIGMIIAILLGTGILTGLLSGILRI
jgi:hypothetical protein